MTRKWSLKALILAVPALLLGCADSPVDKEVTVYLRGDASEEIQLVRMVDVFGFAGRTASVDGEGSYEFAWTGEDLTGFWGERWFTLRVPADAQRGEERTTSYMFHLRGDMTAPYLRIWDSQLDAWKTSTGGLEVSFEPAEGEGYQTIEEYEIVLTYDKTDVDENGNASTTTWTTSTSVPVGGGSLSKNALNNLMPDRISNSVRVSVEAEGSSEVLKLVYHSFQREVQFPLP